jgi:hypothetical protein
MKTIKLFASVMATCALLSVAPAVRAATNSFFNSSQTATLILSSTNSVTIQSGDYQFTYSVDGYWSPVPGGPPTGRFFTVLWPDGVQGQAITAGPNTGQGANILLARADGKLFDLWAFTGKILANTAGAGAHFEIMPQLDGEDALPDPLMFNATGYAGQSFSHTPALRGYDTYKIHLWVDFALTALTLIDTNNQSPLAFGGNFFQVINQPLTVNQSDLMWNDYDPDGSYVGFQGVSATTSNGLALATNATQVLIPANSVADSFTYTIVDSQGATATGTATIPMITNVITRALSLDLVSNPGAVTVNFSGVPWYSFECQRATNVAFTGTLQTWPLQAGPDGTISVYDDFIDVPAQPSEAFYRLRYTPP